MSEPENKPEAEKPALIEAGVVGTPVELIVTRAPPPVPPPDDEKE